MSAINRDPVPDVGTAPMLTQRGQGAYRTIAAAIWNCGVHIEVSDLAMYSSEVMDALRGLLPEDCYLDLDETAADQEVQFARARERRARLAREELEAGQ